MKPFLRTPYNYDREKASLDHGTVNSLPSLTIQSDSDSADINKIVRRFGITNVVQGVQRPPLLDDFDAVFDFQTAMNAVVAARESFESLSASTRKRFGNNPAEFVAFCSDPANLDEMRKMGLAVPAPEPPKPPEPLPVRIVDPAPKT